MRTRFLTGGLAAALALSACAADTKDKADSATGSPSSSASASAAPTSSPGVVTGNITVLAASSLTEVFNKLGPMFEAAHPGVKVTFSYAGSPELAQQIVNKAPADVFAAASPKTMQTVQDAGDASGTPSVFVRNQLEIAVPPSNPANISKLSDFANKDKKFAVCAEAVPCGAAAKKVFDGAGIVPVIATYEQNVKGVLTKVTSGEVDAGMVYQTDVKAAGDSVKGIDFDEAAKAINDYPIVALTGSTNLTTANAWVAFMQTDEAKQAFKDAGFQLP